MAETVNPVEVKSAQECVEVRGWYQGTSNVTKLAAVYSIKRRKFVKGYYKGSRTHGDILYKLLPGTYIFFEYLGWWHNDPPREIVVTLFRITRTEEGFKRERIASSIIRFYKEDFPKGLGIPQIVDFFEARPYYHSFPTLNFDKVYTEEENEKLLNFVMARREIVEGEEHE